LLLQVYSRCVGGLVHSFLSGYNASVLAYGQTNTGKTYTTGMSGVWHVFSGMVGTRSADVALAAPCMSSAWLSVRINAT